MTRFAALREDVWRANLEVVEAGLVILTWGNVSGADRAAGVMAIKPSGVAYAELRPEQMVVVSLDSGTVIDGSLRPSSDTPTHLSLYRAFPGVGGVAHTHSHHAVAWAQAGRDLPCLGTTHADHFHGAVPVTRRLRAEEVEEEYEANTGAVIVESLQERGIDPAAVPAVLVAGHGPFTWGDSPRKAVENAVALESAARMAMYTLALHPDTSPLERALQERHYLRKHGSDSYYGQSGSA
jgi:L-ribulose-5-phosphate 4-epimerase